MSTCYCSGPPGDCACVRRMRGQPEYGALINKPMGCICPPGAEATCRGIGCPRNPPMQQKMVNGELVLAR